MTQILVILALTDIILAGFKTFGLVEPITWTVIYWGFIGLILVTAGVENE